MHTAALYTRVSLSCCMRGVRAGFVVQQNSPRTTSTLLFFSLSCTPVELPNTPNCSTCGCERDALLPVQQCRCGVQCRCLCWVPGGACVSQPETLAGVWAMGCVVKLCCQQCKVPDCSLKGAWRSCHAVPVAGSTESVGRRPTLSPDTTAAPGTFRTHASSVVTSTRAIKRANCSPYSTHIAHTRQIPVERIICRGGDSHCQLTHTKLFSIKLTAPCGWVPVAHTYTHATWIHIEQPAQAIECNVPGPVTAIICQQSTETLSPTHTPCHPVTPLLYDC